MRIGINYLDWRRDSAITTYCFKYMPIEGMYIELYSSLFSQSI